MQELGMFCEKASGTLREQLDLRIECSRIPN